MKVVLESTSKMVRVNGFPCRIWEGETLSGIKVHAFITRVVADAEGSDLREFERELQECRTPSAAISAYPLSLIL